MTSPKASMTSGKSPDASAPPRLRVSAPPRDLRPFRQEMVLDRVWSQTRVVAEPHLLEKARAVRGHALHADVELRRHIARRLAGGDETENLKLAAGEILVRALLCRPHGGERKKLRQRGREKALAARDVADRRHEILARAVLADVAERAAAQRTRRVRRLAMHAQDQDRRDAVQLREDVETGTIGKVEVEDDHVPSASTREVERLSAAPRFAADHDVAGLGNDLLHTFTDDVVVICDEDFDHGRLVAEGIRTETMVPRPL